MSHPKNSIPSQVAQASAPGGSPDPDLLENILRALQAERCVATRLWTGFNEMRMRNELPSWIKASVMGTSAQHDELCELRRRLDALVFPAARSQRVEVSI